MTKNTHFPPIRGLPYTARKMASNRDEDDAGEPTATLIYECKSQPIPPRTHNLYCPRGLCGYSHISWKIYNNVSISLDSPILIAESDPCTKKPAKSRSHRKAKRAEGAPPREGCKCRAEGRIPAHGQPYPFISPSERTSAEPCRPVAAHPDALTARALNPDRRSPSFIWLQ